MLAKHVHHARPELERRFSFAQAVRAGGLLYISGCLSWDEQGAPLAVGDMSGQVAAVYADLERTLAAHGIGFDQVLKETVYTTDMDRFVEAAGIRSEYLSGHSPPSATWLEVGRLVRPEFLLEVEMIALVPEE